MSDDQTMLVSKVASLETHLEAAHEVIAELRAEITDLRCSVIAFAAPVMVEYARERCLPAGHLFSTHYDILNKAGARMDAFTRLEIKGPL